MGRSKGAALAMLVCGTAFGEVNRVVIIKVDGLPERLVERYAAESADGGRAGHSRLPWIQHVFGKNGTWLENFYTRGLSLSAPSWSLLDTGRHLEIRGNAEYDRYTLQVEDYLNFFPFYVSYAMGRHADMAGVELLDDHGVRLLIDRFPPEQQFQSFQLLQRGVRWTTLESSLRSKFASRPLKSLFDEWQTGFSMSSSINEQTERELIEKLKDPTIKYLDYFTGDFDHVAHLTPDRVTQRHVIETLDALVGRIWSAISTGPLADTTALVMVSDHGMNTVEDVYSQGYNLLDWFNSAAGGGHHVLTNRHPMTEFKLKGLDPFVSQVITPSAQSSYLAGESDKYPTVALDLDGNERGNVSLRNSKFNELQILLDALVRKKVRGATRVAVLDAFFATLDRERAAWRREIAELQEDLRDLRVRIGQQQKLVDSMSRKVSAEERKRGVSREVTRQGGRLDNWKAEEKGYAEYAATMERLLALDPADFDPGKFKMEEIIPRRSLGPPNSAEDLRHYVAGPAGFVLGADGKLDMERSFRYIDYFSALGGISVRNNVQKGVAPRPVDFIATVVDGRVWVWGGEDRQAYISTRRGEGGRLELKYDAVHGDPLELNDGEWHEEREWLRTVHRSKYSNAIVGLVEEMLSEPVGSRYLERKRQLRRADMIVFANDHWNFNVRGFNPGGNHGSFLRISTHSVLMMAGGKNTGIPRGLRVETPYDSLSLVPTILALMGRAEPDLPGPVIEELVGERRDSR